MDGDRKNTNELYHHGVKGQRWGVRRYQNPDGSLNAEGKKRQESLKKTKDTISKLTTPSIKGGKDKPNISPLEKMGKESSNAINNATNIANTISRMSSKSKSRSATSNLTNEQLQEAINRMSLEDRYLSLKASRVHDGMAYVNDALSIAGSVVGLTTSAFGIVSAVKTIKG